MNGQDSSGSRPRKPRLVRPLDELKRAGASPAAEAASIRQFELDRAAARQHVERIIVGFLVLNALVFVFVIAAWASERFWLQAGAPIVTERVILALIAGATAQFGTLAVWVGRGIWRGKG